MRGVAVVLAGALLTPGAVALAQEPPERTGVARAAAPGPVVDLLDGRGAARVAITANGKFAIAHQGDSYGPEALLKVNLRRSPAQVTGQVRVPANRNSELALVKNKFALTTVDKNLWVTDIRKAKPKRVGRFSFKVKGSKATLFDVATTPNGKFAFVAARDWIHSPGTHLLVLKVRKNGKPKLLRRVKVKATEIAVSRNGKRLIAAAGKRAHVIDIRKPKKAKKVGKPIKVKGGDVRDVAFGKSANVVHTLSTNGRKYIASRLHVKKRKVTHRRTVVNGSFLGAGGGIAVSAKGKRVVVTSTERGDGEPSAWLLNAKMKMKRSMSTPCLPGAAAASLKGPTKGRLYVADSGSCGQARIWRIL